MQAHLVSTIYYTLIVSQIPRAYPRQWNREAEGTSSQRTKEKRNEEAVRRGGGGKSFCVCSSSKYIRSSLLNAMQPFSEKQERRERALSCGILEKSICISRQRSKNHGNDQSDWRIPSQTVQIKSLDRLKCLKRLSFKCASRFNSYTLKYPSFCKMYNRANIWRRIIFPSYGIITIHVHTNTYPVVEVNKTLFHSSVSIQ